MNRPLRAKGVTRVASPFTIDSERLVRYMTPEEARRGPAQAARDQKWAQRCADAIVAVGVGWRNGRRVDVQNLVEIDPSRKSDTAVSLTHTATLTERQSGKRYNGLIAVLPEDVRCTIGNVQKLLHTAVTNHIGAEALVVVALDFETSAERAGGQHTRIPVIQVRANTDLQIREVTYDDSTPSLPVVGESALRIDRNADGLYTVTGTGWLEFNPLTDETLPYAADPIRSWSLDEGGTAPDPRQRRRRRTTRHSDRHDVAAVPGTGHRRDLRADHHRGWRRADSDTVDSWIIGRRAARDVILAIAT